MSAPRADQGSELQTGRSSAPETLATHLPGAAFVLRLAPDGTSRFPYVAPSCEDIYGIPASAVMAEASLLHRAIHPDEQVSFRTAWQESVDLLHPLYWEGRVLHTDGRARAVTITSQPRRLPDGATEWHGIVVPREGVLAPEPDAVEVLAARERHQSDLLAMLGHDIGTPLAAVLASAELALGVLDDPTTVVADEVELLRRSLLIVTTNARRLEILRRDLLALTSADAGHLVAHPEPVRLLPHLQAAAELVLGGADVEVRCSSTTTCLVQASHLDQVLANLVSNADKHARGRIVITAREAEDRVAITIDDDGPGVPPELRAWLFTRYARSPQQPDVPIPGTGLGLHIVHRLAIANGGTTYHQPSALGGARFAIELIRPDQGLLPVRATAS